MNPKIRCGSCQAKIRISEKHVGRRFACPRCESEIRVSREQFDRAKEAAQRSAQTSDQDSKRVAIRCHGCNAKLRVLTRKLGRTSNCPKCKQMILLQVGPQPKRVAPDPRLKGPPKPVPTPGDDDKLRASPSVASTTSPKPKTSVKKSSHEKKKERSTSRLPLIAIGVVASMLLAASIGGLLFWIFSGPNPNSNQLANKPKSASKTESSNLKTQKPNGRDGAVETSTDRASPDRPKDSPPRAKPKIAPDKSKPEVKKPATEVKRPKPTFDLVYKMGSPDEPIGYQFESKVTSNGQTEKFDGRFLIQPELGDTGYTYRIGGRNGIHRARTEETVTGLGIPGRRILIPYDVGLQGTKFAIFDGKNTYFANSVTELENADVTVLEYSGPDFPPLEICPTSEIYGSLNVLKRSDEGPAFRLEMAARRLSSYASVVDPWSVRSSPLPDWIHGVAFKSWGTVCGLVGNNKVIPINKFAGIIGAPDPFISTFEVVSNSDQENIDRISKNVVKVVVMRKRREKQILEFKHHVVFENPRTSKLDDLNLVAENASAKEDLRENGSIGLVLQAPLPGLPYTAPKASFEELRSGQWTWKRTDIGYLMNESKGLFFRASKPKRWERDKKSKSKAKFEHQYTITSFDEASSIVDIEHSFLLHNVGSNANQFEGKEQIKFDTELGLIKSRSLNGDWSIEGPDTPAFKINVVHELSLMNPLIAREKHAELPELFPENKPKTPLQTSRNGMKEPVKDYGIIPTVPLSKINLDSLLRQLNSDSQKTRFEGIKQLSQVIPEPNQKISEALAFDYKGRFKGANPFRLLSRRVARQWILKKDLPMLLELYVDNKSMDGTTPLVLDLLTIHGPVPKSHDFVVKKFLKLDLKRREVLRIIRAHYSHWAEELYLEELQNGKKPIQAFDMLRDFGTAQSLDVLKKIQSETKKTSYLRSSIDQAIKAISKRG